MKSSSSSLSHCPDLELIAAAVSAGVSSFCPSSPPRRPRLVADTQLTTPPRRLPDTGIHGTWRGDSSDFVILLPSPAVRLLSSLRAIQARQSKAKRVKTNQSKSKSAESQEQRAKATNQPQTQASNHTRPTSGPQRGNRAWAGIVTPNASCRYALCVRIRPPSSPPAAYPCVGSQARATRQGSARHETGREAQPGAGFLAALNAGC